MAQSVRGENLGGDMPVGSIDGDDDASSFEAFGKVNERNSNVIMTSEKIIAHSQNALSKSNYTPSDSATTMVNIPNSNPRQSVQQHNIQRTEQRRLEGDAENAANGSTASVDPVPRIIGGVEVCGAW